MDELKSLPIGTQTFSALRSSGQIYVDKTEMIHRLACEVQKIFLARPRRFGKSLLLRTFASLFEYGLRDFQGLAIEKLWKDSTYETVCLDFSMVVDFDTVDDFKVKFYSMLSEELEEHGFAWNGNTESFSYQLSRWFKGKADASLVLLIDEYDSPLTKVLNKKELFQGIQKVMQEFFVMLKSNDGCFRFMFLTGITRLSNTSIFSGLNNMIDISRDVEYGTLTGYTEAELVDYFGGYLERASRSLGISREALLAKMREYYDGFSFDKDAATHVYCPWSVLNFLKGNDYRFENYWFESGGQPSVLMNYLAERKLEEPLDFLKTVPMSSRKLFSSEPYQKLDVNVLLHQTGYLTIRSINKAGNFQLGYPNREVEASMAQLYARVMVGDDDFESDDILNYMLEGDVEDTVRFINQVFNALDYERYPIRDEASFRGMIQILMIGLSLRPHVEVHTARGRSDMEVEAGDYRWVFELKFARPGDDAEALCDEAVEQIRSRDYGNTPRGGKLIRVGMVFEEAERRVTRWRVA